MTRPKDIVSHLASDETKELRWLGDVTAGVDYKDLLEKGFVRRRTLSNVTATAWERELLRRAAEDKLVVRTSIETVAHGVQHCVAWTVTF